MPQDCGGTPLWPCFHGIEPISRRGKKIRVLLISDLHLFVDYLLPTLIFDYELVLPHDRDF